MAEEKYELTIETENATFLHRHAMDLAEFAFVAKNKKTLSEDTIRHIYQSAFLLESAAADLIDCNSVHIRARAALYYSAASLAMNCNLEQSAMRLVQEGLKGNPPPENVAELVELRDEINGKANTK